MSSSTSSRPFPFLRTLLQLRGGARLCVLVYHRLRDPIDALDTWNPDAGVFERHVETLAACFTPLGLAEAVERMATNSLPPRAVAVTFDDGYRDNVDAVLPILKRHGVPATFFISTGYLDGGRMWNDTVVEAVRATAAPALDLAHWGLPAFPLSTVDERRNAILAITAALKYEPPPLRQARVAELAERAGRPLPASPMLRSEDVRTLRGAGMDIGAHTISHPILARIDPAAAREEIEGSREQLRSLLREPVTLFAYPNGRPVRDYGPEHVRMAKEAGFRAAWSTAPGLASATSDLHQIPRVTPWQREPARFAWGLGRLFLGRPRAYARA